MKKLKSIVIEIVKRLTFWAWREELEHYSWWVPKVRK